MQKVLATLPEKHYNKRMTTTTMTIIATANHGAIRKGETFTATAKTNSMGQTRLVLDGMPRATLHPTLFFGKDGQPDSGRDWNRFAIA
jgi:hypothetical protein